jgi:hypothetical protein
MNKPHKRSIYGYDAFIAEIFPEAKMGRWFNCSSSGIGGDGLRLPGVYAMFWGNQAIYVGQSKNVEKRLYKHGCNRSLEQGAHGEWYLNWYDKTYYLGKDRCFINTKMAYSPRLKDRLEREAKMILALSPIANIHGVQEGRKSITCRIPTVRRGRPRKKLQVTA